MAKQVLSEETKATLVERIRNETIHVEEVASSENYVSTVIGFIANGYICGLCGKRIKGKMKVLTDKHTTPSGAEATTRYFTDEECYQNAKNPNSKQ